jgi:hypothetical protein
MEIQVTDECLKLIEVGGKYLQKALTPHRDKPIEVVRGVFTGKDYSYFLVALAEGIEELRQLYSTGPDRLTRYNFDNVLQLAGFPMQPMGAPALLKHEVEPPEEAMEMLQCIIEDYTEEFQKGLSLSIAKVSSSGPPFYSHDLKYKASIIRDWIVNVDEICNTFKREGYMGLLNRGNPICPFFGTNFRMQTDTISAEYKGGKLVKAESKLREVEDWLGKHTFASKELPKGFCRLISRVRSRLVWAMSGTINYVLGALMQGFRYVALNKTMKAILHHPDVRQTILSLKGCLKVASWDITRFDHQIRARIQQMWVQRFRSLGIREEVCTMMEDAIYGPAIFASDYNGVPGYNVTSYPLSTKSRIRTPNMDFGLESGIWWVADVGKTTGLWIPMWSLYREGIIKDFRDRKQRQMFYDNKFDWYLIYKGSGDDTIAGENTTGAIAKVIEHAAELGFELKEDAEAGFLGMNLVQENGAYEVRPNLASGLTKFWVPERRISRSPHDMTPRRFYAYGIPLRNEYYNQHPLWGEVWNRSLDIAEKYFNLEIRKGLEKARREQEIALDKLVDLDNVYDRMFLENAEYIHYRINPQDVSPKLLETQFLVIPPEDVSKLLVGLGYSQAA